MESAELRLLSRPAGSSKALIFMDGYLSEEKVRNSTLLDALDKVGWKHSVYHLWWDSGSDDISRHIVAPIHWHKTKFRAERVGQDYLPSLINYQIPEHSICLLTHSLGARVAYYCMETWVENQHFLQDVILLTGAIRRDSSKDWGYVASKVRGYLINVYNNDDPRLKKYFKLAEAGNNACGRKPIKEYHPKIINEDGTYLIGKTHKVSTALNYLPELLRKGLW